MSGLFLKDQILILQWIPFLWKKRGVMSSCSSFKCTIWESYLWYASVSLGISLFGLPHHVGCPLLSYHSNIASSSRNITNSNHTRKKTTQQKTKRGPKLQIFFFMRNYSDQKQTKKSVQPQNDSNQYIKMGEIGEKQISPYSILQFRIPEKKKKKLFFFFPGPN